MATQPASIKRKPVPVTEAILRQTEAIVASQTDDAESPRREALMSETDLTIPDAEDDVPPPAYGDTYGEIRSDKDGLNTNAYVTDDGRVNIRINQLNRRLSQILTPALRQHIQGVEDSQQRPTYNAFPSLAGDKKHRLPPPPALNIVIQVVGSRGDVQPFVALGKVLKQTYGHRVRLATHPNFRDFVQENGLEFFSIGGNPSQLMAFMVKNPSLLPGFRSLWSGDVSQRRRDVAEYIQGCWRSCYQSGDGLAPQDGSDPESAERPFVADCIIANPPSFAHIHCAEKLGIPLHIMFTMPYSPTQAFPHPLANIQSTNADPQLTNYISYAMIEVMCWQGLGDIINRFRAKCLGLDPVSLIWAPGMLHRLKIPHTYCWSPALIPKPRDWGSHVSVAGFCFLDLASHFTPAPDLQAFLDAGPPPVYIGFGSIVLDKPDTMTELIFEAAKKTGQRILLSKGWGGMGAHELRIPDSVFMLGNVPHDWLFQHVSCVVHHGGAGTTAAGITAGRPTLVVPFFGDQPFWGAMVARAGAGPDPIPHKQLTADRLADAIDFCLRPESQERAKDLASQMAAERGSEMAAHAFHQQLDPDRLRCTLAPSRPAVWRIKRTQIRLSVFAACTLVNANLLDFQDLKLFRAQEYQTDEGAWDPVSGGLIAAFGAFSNLATGLAGVPTETYKAAKLPFDHARKRSQTSVPKAAVERKSSSLDGNSAPPTPPHGSQIGHDVAELPGHARSSSLLSNASSRSSTTEPSSTSDAVQGNSAAKQHSISKTSVRSQNEARDMLRQTGPHTSKGLGRLLRTFIRTPMDVSMSLHKGFNNMPKIWGDDTVRPQTQVTDFVSGGKAAGKHFGLGMYDGITGIVTQPYNGARKEGVIGFGKGVGKGLGGFITKQSAGLCGLLGYTMKGVHKEVQKLFGSNVQNYIVASRAAQGYEEWSQSSDAETQDVIARWKLIQKYVKKGKQPPDEMVRDVLEAQRNLNMQVGAKAYRDNESTRSFSRSTSDGSESLNTVDAALITETPRLSEESLGAHDPTETLRTSTSSRQTSREDLRNIIGAEQVHPPRLLRREDEATAHRADLEDSRVAVPASEVNAQRHTSELFSGPVAASSSRSVAREPVRSPSYDPGHLSGTTQAQFEARQQGEKTAQEQTEEEIVMAYVKKQSLLEREHRPRKGEGSDGAADDDDLRKALELSMLGYDQDGMRPYGEASRA